MSFFHAMDVSASGLTAQRLRMDVISENIANVNTTRTDAGGPYKRKAVLFEERKDNNTFSTYLDNAMNGSRVGNGVRVTQVTEDETPGALAYDPGNPDANAEGYVRQPNVNIVEEMVNMISASRSYEANVTSINTTKSMISKTLEISR